MKSKILLTTQIPQWVQVKLASNLPDFEILRVASENLASLKNENVIGLLVRSQTEVKEKLLDHFNNLKFVGTATSGFDHLNINYLKDKNIISFYTPEANVQSTADLTLFHILNVLRENIFEQLNQKNFQWKNQMPLGQELQNKSLGLLGFGRIGQAVAKRALSFGFKVYFHDPYIDFDHSNALDSFKSSTGLDQSFRTADGQTVVEPLGRLELFTHCDIISLHTPLTRKTKYIIDKHTLDHFGEDKILINCARGELVHTRDLLEAIDKGIIKYAGLDTFETEPLPQNSVLRHHPRIFWTPHIGAYTSQAFEKSCLEAAQVIIELLLQDKRPKALLPPDVPWATDL